MKQCSWIDLSAYHAAIDKLPSTATMLDRDKAYKANPGVKCTQSAAFRVEMYAEHEDDDSQVHMCGEHVNEWQEDEHTSIFPL